MAFLKRVAAPSSTDKNWIGIKHGGKNHALVINSTTGSVLPNCTGYVHGRWIELGLDESKLCLYNADQYYNYTRDGFARGKTPKLGAIMCWSCPGKAGHVASVEGFTSSTSVTASQSNYGGTKFYIKTFNPNTWPSGYTFQGYIYPPVEFSLDDGIGTPVTRDETKIQVLVAYDYLRARSTPSTSGKELGYINRGIYNMPSSAGIIEANNYKWYEVESNTWIADVGEPEVTILPATQKPKDYSALLKIGFASTGDIKTIKAFIKEKGIDCTTPETGYLITVTAPSGKDRDDIDAKCLALGVPCVEYASNDDAKIEELQQQIKVLTAQVTTLTTQLSETNNELTSMITELESIKASNNTLTASNELYVSVLKEIDEAIDKLN